jgi:hypothetical protein
MPVKIVNSRFMAANAPIGLFLFARTAQICLLCAFDGSPERGQVFGGMLQVKDTLRATVQVSFDGRVFKTYHGADARKRFNQEVRVLKYLESRNCGFVPKLLEADVKKLRICTTNCGTRVDHLDAERAKQLFAELETFGVRHDDPEMRNVTYRQSDGRFCVIDFELATILLEHK